MDNPAFVYDYVCLKPDKQIGLHSQDTWELSHVIRGKGTRTIGDKTEPIAEGEVILIPPHIPHVWNFDPTGTDINGDIINIVVFFDQVILERIEAFFPESRQSVNRLILRSDTKEHLPVAGLHAWTHPGIPVRQDAGSDSTCVKHR